MKTRNSTHNIVTNKLRVLTLTCTCILPSLNDLKWPTMPLSVGVNTKPSLAAVTEYCSWLSSGPTLLSSTQYNTTINSLSRLLAYETHTHTHAHTHTHTHTRLTALCPGIPGWAGTRKVKPMWILLKQETVSGRQWHPLGHMQVCTSLQTDNHASTPPLSFLQAGCPSCRPTNSVRALKAYETQQKTQPYAIHCSMDCRTLYCTSWSLHRMPLHDWLLARNAVIISCWNYANSIGYPPESASSSKWHA